MEQLRPKILNNIELILKYLILKAAKYLLMILQLTTKMREMIISNSLRLELVKMEEDWREVT